MVPFTFKNSDGLFNLGAAVTAVQLLGKGVFIAMNGKVFPWDNVRKNFDLGEFQEKG
jgi:L-asparaginase